MDLDAENKREFKKHGYLTIKGAVDDEIVRRAREEVRRRIKRTNQDDYESISDIDNTEPFGLIRNTLREYAACLVGEGKLQSSSGSIEIPDDIEIKVNYPSNTRYGSRVQYRTPGGHEDGYVGISDGRNNEGAGSYDYHTVGATVYLSDVAKGGGGFTVFPGSHWVVADYFSDHALNSLGWQACPPAIDANGWDYDQRLDQQLKAEEITGPSGTIILWHMRLLHGANVNQKSTPRLAVITRFTHKKGEEIKQDAVPNLWKYWDGIPQEGLDDQ